VILTSDTQQETLQLVGVLSFTTIRVLFVTEENSKAFQFWYKDCTKNEFLGRKYICHVGTTTGDDTDEEDEESQKILLKL